MLQSAKLQRRQSEVRSRLAELAGIDKLTDEQRNELRNLDSEYQDNEAKYRAALIAEDEQRSQAGKELETRSSNEWAGLIEKFEVRQIVAALDTGEALNGATAEVVQEMRSKHRYTGLPMPLEALELRVGETVATNLPDPVRVHPIMDRLFPQSVAAAMGTRMINIASGSESWPITTDGATAAWAASETGDVGGPTPFKTAARSVSPDHTLGVQMRVTRKALAQTAGLEGAIRRDMVADIQKEIDRAIFLGSGSSGEPNGIISKASTYSIAENTTAAAASWSMFQSEIIAFMADNTANGPGAVRIMMRPEVWQYLDSVAFLNNTAGITEYSVLQNRVQDIVLTSNALAAPATDQSKVLMTTGEAIYFATWGGIDLIRDPYSDAQSGGLRVTALITCDVTAGRKEQLRVLTKVKNTSV